MGRLLLVSNRLPVTISSGPEGLTVAQSTGGLAVGLRGPHERAEGLWFGWPGNFDDRRSATRARVRKNLAVFRAVPLFLNRAEIRRYYHGFANGVIWPLFHYLLDRVPLQARDWSSYRAVNERFADLVVRHYRPGDTIWVHDYHLLLLPGLIRARIPDATIGFFLHIPFPSSEVFRLLPWREAILQGLLGADLIGFHTATYLRHFSVAVTRLLNLEMDVNEVSVEGRRVRLGVFAMGIDAAHLAELAKDGKIIERTAAIRAEHLDSRILLSVDRLDYTKGIPRRLLAFERLLESEPSLQGRARLIQIAAPSRLDGRAYQTFRRQVDGLVGRINSRFTTFGSVPIHYLMQKFSQRELISLYRAADVMWVTPLRDGMNLVAKEYIACRPAEDGVLILSEFAGAAAQLADALHVNPYDIDGQVAAVKRALAMSPEEQRARMHRLHESVVREDVHFWAASFIGTLDEIAAARARTDSTTTYSSPARLEDLSREIRAADSVALFLDYDGTLVSFTADPNVTQPDSALLELLESLARRPGCELHLVSGRKKEQIEQWFGRLPIGLHAEHGLWSRWSEREDWMRLVGSSPSWKETVMPLLEEFARRTPGTQIEEKDASLVWHYRQAEPAFGSMQAKELRLHLLEVLSNLPVRILGGAKTVEVRSYGVHKGVIVTAWRAGGNPDALLVAIGDDVTDEDMFAALPDGAIAIHVGSSPSTAGIRMRDPQQVRRFLMEIASAPVPAGVIQESRI